MFRAGRGQSPRRTEDGRRRVQPRGHLGPRTVRRGPRAGLVPRGALPAAASGVLIGATFSPYGGAVLPFLAFAPLGGAIAAGRVVPGGLPRAAVRSPAPPGRGFAPPRAPFALGFIAAFVAHGIGLYWMIPALAWRTALAAPAYLVVLSLIGMLAGAACQGAVTLHRRLRWPVPLALAACWTGSEWVAAHVPGFSYAWLSAGGSLAWYPALAAGSEVLGARFLTVWTVAVGAGVGGVCASWLSGPSIPRRISRRTALALGLAVLPAAAGLVRQWSLGAEQPLVRIAAVQPGREAVPADDLAQWLEPLRATKRAGAIDLAVFPERYLASPLRDPGGGERYPAGARLASIAEALGSPILVGAMDLEDDSGTAGEAAGTLWYNAAFLQSPDGTLSPAYRKVRLVPGLEGPFGSRGYSPGREAAPLIFGPGRIGAMVCYDSAFGETARALVRGGAEWLAVLSNDDWLDPGAPFQVTWAYRQHATHGRLRAIENRISLVQVAATGYTFAVPPSGMAPSLPLEPGEAGVAVLSVSRRGGTTLFTRTGDVLGLACVLCLVAALAVRAPRRRAAGTRSQGPPVEPRTDR